MGKFNLASLLNNQPPAAANSPKSSFEIVPISIFDIEPSQDNFYSVEQIQELKTAIELAGGIKQNGVVVPLGNGKYKAIAGHRRRLALMELVQEGKPEYEFFPCKVEKSEEEVQKQADHEELLLILTNSQREKTDWEKMEEVRRLRAILERNQEKGIRSKLAEALNTSQTAIGRLDAIAKHLIPEFQQEMKENRLGVSAAYELSGLSEAEQRQALSECLGGKGFSVDAARQKKQSAPAIKTPPEVVAMLNEMPKEKIVIPKLAAEEKPPAEKQAVLSRPIPSVAIKSIPEMVTGDKINVSQQIDVIKEILFDLSANKIIDNGAVALIIQALDFYRLQEGWKQ